MKNLDGNDGKVFVETGGCSPDGELYGEWLTKDEARKRFDRGVDLAFVPMPGVDYQLDNFDDLSQSHR